MLTARPPHTTIPYEVNQNMCLSEALQSSCIHRRRLWGQPGHVPPIFEKRLCIHQLLPPFPPPNIFISPNILDKSMLVAVPVNGPTVQHTCQWWLHINSSRAGAFGGTSAALSQPSVPH